MLPWPACPSASSGATCASRAMSSFAKFTILCACTFVISDSRTLLHTAGKIFANLLTPRMRSLHAMACSASTRSSLFKMILSAKAICWYAMFTFPCSTSSSSRPTKCFASAKATTASKRRSKVRRSLDMKVRIIGTGSAIPVDSIMMASMPAPAFMSSTICKRPFSKSPRMVQHTQPFSMTTTRSANAFLSCFRRASSMETSPNSFSMIAIFISRCSRRM
mmetsp:Transcript_7802/g.19287  ORF Transcript_7802/g.19287 Transcript_7802/m.19287 type:complete len:220 (-) Transcript_7802:287-946(-)